MELLRLPARWIVSLDGSAQADGIEEQRVGVTFGGRGAFLTGRPGMFARDAGVASAMS